MVTAVRYTLRRARIRVEALEGRKGGVLWCACRQFDCVRPMPYDVTGNHAPGNFRACRHDVNGQVVSCRALPLPSLLP